jgi:hypothetical protein
MPSFRFRLRSLRSVVACSIVALGVTASSAAAQGRDAGADAADARIDMRVPPVTPLTAPPRGTIARDAWISTLATSSRRTMTAQSRPAHFSDPFSDRCSKTAAALIGAGGGFVVGAVVGARGNSLPGPWIDGAVGASIGALAGVLLCGN